MVIQLHYGEKSSCQKKEIRPEEDNDGITKAIKKKRNKRAILADHKI